jgi:filamentous hemagglutinin family protein
MNIVIQYDSSAASAPAGFQTAVQAAVNYLDNLIATPITVPITFSYGEIQGKSLSSGSIGESSYSGGFVSYSQLKSALTTAATSADDNASVQALPATDPTNGGQFFVTAAQAAALHISGISAVTDGYVGLASNFSFSFDPSNRAQSGKYDAIGVLEHEITEVLGRDGILGSWTSGGKAVYAPLDLFRYSSAGAHQLSAGAGSFSVDGTTMLTPFNNPSNGGDAGDWASSVVGDSFGDASPDTVGQVTATDQRVLDVLGYTLSGSTTAPTPAPTPTTGSTYTATAATVSANLDALNTNSSVSSIVVSDNAAVTVSVAQLSSDAHALGELKNANGSAYTLDVKDTGAHISSALTALAANSHVSAMQVTDGAVVTVANSQYAADTAVLNKITGAHTVEITGYTGTSYTAQDMVYDSNGVLAERVYHNTDGSLSTTGLEGGLTFQSSTQKQTITVSNPGDTFVFKPASRPKPSRATSRARTCWTSTARSPARPRRCSPTPTATGTAAR